MNNFKNSLGESQSGTNVHVNVDVTKIVKYSCITSVLVLFIIFGSKVLNQMLKK